MANFYIFIVFLLTKAEIVSYNEPMENKNILQLDINQTLYTAQLNIADKSLQVAFEPERFIAGNVSTAPNAGNKSQQETDAKQLHFHLYFEIFCVFDKQMLLITENKTYTFQNQIVIVPPHLNHYAFDYDQTKNFCLDFQSTKPENTFVLPPHLLTANTIFSFPLDEETDIYLKLLQQALQSHSQNARLKIPPLLNAMVLHFFDLLSMHVQASMGNPSSDFLKYITKLELIFSRIYTEDIKLSHIAKELFLSEKQVARIIKKAYNCTLSELIVNKKLSTACNLLRSTDKSIADIIKDLNIKTESYFFVLFKQHYGCTPLAYRKQTQNQLKNFI